MPEYRIKRKAALISLSVGAGMFLAKMGAYLLTGSAAIFSDAAESVVHVLATLMAFYSIILSSKPADESHPYGHGNIEYFSAGTEGMLIIFAAIYIIYESVFSLIRGPVLKQLGFGAIIISAASVINLLLGFYLVRTGKKTNSLTLVADGKHVLTDSYTSFGVIVGVFCVLFTGYKILDPLFAIGVALNILYTGYKLIRQSIGGLMHENDPKLMQQLADKLISIKKDHWIDIHELRFWRSGEKMFMDFHIIYPYYFTIKQSHTEEKVIRDSINQTFPETQVKIHFDYCIPELCKFCGYFECKFRHDDKDKDFEWNLKKLMGKPVYMMEKGKPIDNKQ